jgi:hypothetical protein
MSDDVWNVMVTHLADYKISFSHEVHIKKYSLITV